MARFGSTSPPHSPSPELTPGSASPPLSQSSLEGISVAESNYGGPSASRPSSPARMELPPYEGELESVTCQWAECGKSFTYLPTMIDHIHNEHIKVNRSNYTCEWANCGRRGIQQASRFALISHIRQHTGEKPFVCRLPECDKSFTRSDAMAKHMRHQHNIIPEVHGRGGNRKRKREEPPAVEEPVAPGFATFKVEGTPNELPSGVWETDGRLSPPIDLTENSHIRRRSISPAGMSVMSTDDPDDLSLPESLLQNLDPETGLIEGKSVMAWRCIMAEQTVDYLLNEHEHLLEELRTVRNEELREKAAKEQALERFLRVQFGPEAEFLIAEPNIEHIRRYQALTNQLPQRRVPEESDNIEHDL